MKIFLIGFMGSGKSHWGHLLSQKLGLRFFDLDKQIEEENGKSVNEIFSTEGEEHFRLLEKEILYIITESHDNFIMACGGGAPCFYKNIDYMNDAGLVVWLNPPIEKILERLIKEKNTRPLIRDLSVEAIGGFIHKKMTDRKIYYEQARLMITEENIKIENLVEKIFHA